MAIQTPLGSTGRPVFVMPGGEVWSRIEASIADSLPKGNLIRATGLGRHVLCLINTKREYGRWAVLEWAISRGALHTGHYFDSAAEAMVDFTTRGGNTDV